MKKPTPGEDLPALFRSIRPDSANFQATITAAAQEAEQRWPLFKAMSPQIPEPTPALSEEERLHWSAQEKPGSAERKPALARLGVNDKLTKSLRKMSGPGNDTLVAPPLPAPATQNKPGRELPPRINAPRVNKPVKSASILFAEVAPVTKPDIKIKSTKKGLFGQEIELTASEPDGPAIVIGPVTPKVLATDDSLASVFGRLREKEIPATKPAAKKSSFLGRLGKK